MKPGKFHVFVTLIAASLLLLVSLLVQTERFTVVNTASNNSPAKSRRRWQQNVSSPVTTNFTLTFTLTTSRPYVKTEQPRQGRFNSQVKPFPDDTLIDSSENEIDDSVNNRVIPVVTTAPATSIQPATRKAVKAAKSQTYNNQRIFLPLTSMDFIYGLMDTHLARDSEEQKALEESSSASLPAAVPRDRVHHLLIFSYFRGGTTFFSELLAELPAAFLHFEPLHFISLNEQVENLNLTDNAMNMVRDLLNCRFDEDYVRYASQQPNDFLLSRHKRMWNYCRLNGALCSSAKFWAKSCALYAKHDIHLNIMKLVRLRLRHAKTFLEEFPDLKVIHLVRDPRALYASRKSLPWCSQTQSCIDPNVFCPYAMQEDAFVAQELRESYKDRFLEMRHEDVASDPRAATIQVMKFLNRPWDPLPMRVDRFLSTHTKTAVSSYMPMMYHNLNRFRRFNPPQMQIDASQKRRTIYHFVKREGGINNDPYSTRRDSQSTIDKWKMSLAPSEISQLQKVCYPVLIYYNYELVQN